MTSPFGYKYECEYAKIECLEAPPAHDNDDPVAIEAVLVAIDATVRIGAAIDPDVASLPFISRNILACVTLVNAVIYITRSLDE